ncbi:MAG TPA: L-histidine N(alpha)-methyltransferase [Verrucomicrobiae bacterium]|jgi:L-histidine N-alpha-methyltransferase|nr:L-histidine N(alpha)-methyltransferase [Verrucomicrobiae bacterium]
MDYRIDVYTDGQTHRRTLEDDVRRGLLGNPRSLPPKYFYDRTGSLLFERITTLPEYYLTRTEAALLTTVAPALVGDVAHGDIVEIGPGSGGKIRTVLDALNGHRRHVRYVPLDVDRLTLGRIATQLIDEYPGLSIHAIAGDFERDLIHVPTAEGRRLVLFLGSTIGNLDAPQRRRFLEGVRGLLSDPADRFLLGVDLVKDVKVLEAAYDDAAGVTREFNRNILRVVNRGVRGDFRPEAFRHLAFYNEAASRIEMHLVADSAQDVRLERLGLSLHFAAGDDIWTESSCKFTRAGVETMLDEAGLHLAEWHVDPASYFALALARPRG